MVITAINAIGALAAAISAFCWIKAARISVPIGSWWDGPPSEVAQMSRNQAWWNGMAAWAAAVVGISQALALLRGL
jgi:hypothetical protein